MSTKKRANNTERLKLLHSVGVAKDIKATKKNPLTKSESSKVSRLWKDYGRISLSPGAFQKVNISRFSERDQKTFKKNQYAIVGNTAYIPRENASKIKVYNAWSKDEDGNPIKVLKVRREYPASMKKQPQETLLHSDGLEFMSWRDRLIQEYKDAKLPEGSVIGLKVFDNSAMRIERIDINELIKYAENIKWDTRNGQSIASLQNNLHLVIIYKNMDGGKRPSEGVISDRERARLKRKYANPLRKPKSTPKKKR